VSFKASIASSGRWSLISSISSGDRLMKLVDAILVGALGGGNSCSEGDFRMPKAGYECRNEVV
jgi:hypothetical protein